jgi:SAM-dependent methyltransferase
MNRVLVLGQDAEALAAELGETGWASPEAVEELPTAAALPHETGSFDLVVVAGPLPGHQQDRDWLTELSRVLAPEGTVLMAPAGLPALRSAQEAIRGRLDEQRLEFDRELKRKAFRIAELELGRTPTPSYWANAERVAAEYEATLSWRVTRPLRAAKRILSRS